VATTPPLTDIQEEHRTLTGELKACAHYYKNQINTHESRQQELRERIKMLESSNIELESQLRRVSVQADASYAQLVQSSEERIEALKKFHQGQLSDKDRQIQALEQRSTEALSHMETLRTISSSSSSLSGPAPASQRMTISGFQQLPNVEKIRLPLNQLPTQLIDEIAVNFSSDYLRRLSVREILVGSYEDYLHSVTDLNELIYKVALFMPDRKIGHFICACSEIGMNSAIVKLGVQYDRITITHIKEHVDRV
jgi:hypothetical protein